MAEHGQRYVVVCNNDVTTSISPGLAHAVFYADCTEADSTWATALLGPLNGERPGALPKTSQSEASTATSRNAYRILGRATDEGNIVVTGAGDEVFA